MMLEFKIWWLKIITFPKMHFSIDLAEFSLIVPWFVSDFQRCKLTRKMKDDAILILSVILRLSHDVNFLKIRQEPKPRNAFKKNVSQID